MTGRTKSPTETGLPGFISADRGLPGLEPAHASVLETHSAIAAEKRAKGTYLQYLGFTHEGNVRIFRFRRVCRGEEAREFIVNVDLALFAKHHVSLQEGPALSLQCLSSEADGGITTPLLRCLTDVEMLAYVAGRTDRSPAGRRAKAALPSPAVSQF